MKRFLIGVCLACVVPTSAWAWGQEGHSVIAEIAQRNLSPKTEKAIRALLGPGASLASISSWADDVRTARPESSNWHFTSTPLAAKTFDPERDCKETHKGDCIVAELNRLKTELNCGASLDKKREALKFAVHFVGDVHQPLHTVSDQIGGNTVKVVMKAKGVTSKTVCEQNCPISDFHKVWDSELIHKEVWSWGALLDRAMNESPPLPAADSVEPVDWANETHVIAIDMWALAMKNKDAGGLVLIDDAYLAAAKPVVTQRLSWAGQRLARFLDKAYSVKCGQ